MYNQWGYLATDVSNPAGAICGYTYGSYKSQTSPEKDKDSQNATAAYYVPKTTITGEPAKKHVVPRSQKVTYESLRAATLSSSSSSDSEGDQTAIKNIPLPALLRDGKTKDSTRVAESLKSIPEKRYPYRTNWSCVNKEPFLACRPNEADQLLRLRDLRIAPKVRIDPSLVKFLGQIFKWNPDLLEVENDVGGSSPIVNEGELVAMLPVYRTYKEYYRIVEPLLILELWHRILRDYEEEKKSPWRCSIFKSKTETFPSCTENVSMSVLELSLLQIYKTHPTHGDLVIFDYTSKTANGADFPARRAFAYVTNVLSGRMDERYVVLTKPLIDADLRSGEVRPVSYIRPDMRSVQALRYLPTSPLGNIILRPRIEDYRLPAANNLANYSLVTKDRLNAKQLEAVARITATVAQDLPRICLIHGPPGTGKSRVIVNLITQIIRGKDRRCSYEKTTQILMCAPSNTAVDEVVLRLMNVNKTLEAEQSFSLVRIGRVEQMNPLVKEVLPRELAKKIVERADRFDKRRGDFDYDRRRNARICKEEAHLLRDADVIACTLTSCYTDKMESVFGSGSGAISVCIVDEATQSVEPDTLIPLMLGVKTLVLVGDTKQLPATVLSQKAKKLGLDQSLFARISKAFEGESENPIIKLDTQYRMADPIALFPNRHFYDGALKNAAKMRALPLHFYRVFNLDATQSSDKFSNSDEAKFVANLMYALIAGANYGGAILPISVGVITPYNNQKTLLKKKISERISGLKDRTKIDYEVNTVDSFQGQERDIMIMSCVRSHGIGFLADRQRLCVALTRAKHSLILCGNFKTFENDPTWKALLEDAKDRGVYTNLKASAKPDCITPFIVR